MDERFDSQLLRGSLELMLLSVLVDGPAFGYRLQQRIREASEQRIKVDAGTLYPLLHRLEADEWIRSWWDDSTGRRRKWYELTAAGRLRLAGRAEQWSEYAACMQRLLKPVLKPAVQPT